MAHWESVAFTTATGGVTTRWGANVNEATECKSKGGERRKRKSRRDGDEREKRDERGVKQSERSRGNTAASA